MLWHRWASSIRPLPGRDATRRACPSRCNLLSCRPIGLPHAGSSGEGKRWKDLPAGASVILEWKPSVSPTRQRERSRSSRRMQSNPQPPAPRFDRCAALQRASAKFNAAMRRGSTPSGPPPAASMRRGSIRRPAPRMSSLAAIVAETAHTTDVQTMTRHF